MAHVLQTWVLSTDETYKIVGEVLQELWDETMNDPRIAEDVAGKIGFVDEPVTQKNGYFQTILGVTPAEFVSEFAEFTLDEKEFGNKKYYDVVRVYKGHGTSSEASKWIDIISANSEIPADIKKQVLNSKSESERIVKSIKLAQNNYYTRILTEGFSISSKFWPWSKTAYDKPLFATDHPVGETGATQSNLLTGADAPLTFANLLKAIELHRGMKDGLGVKVNKANTYRLIVSRANEKLATDILSESNGFAPVTYTGTAATNNNYGNVFMRPWYKVQLVVLETLGQPNGKGGTIGTDTMWFLINEDAMAMRKAFIKFQLKELEVAYFKDDKTKASYFTAELHFGAEHMYPEVIVGSQWV